MHDSGSCGSGARACGAQRSSTGHVSTAGRDVWPSRPAGATRSRPVAVPRQVSIGNPSRSFVWRLMPVLLNEMDPTQLRMTVLQRLREGDASAMHLDAIERIDRLEGVLTTWGSFVDAHVQAGVEAPRCGFPRGTPVLAVVVSGVVRRDDGAIRRWATLVLSAADGSRMCREFPAPDSEIPPPHGDLPGYWPYLST